MPTSNPAPLAPFLLWTNLAYKVAEMLLASAQVISHRTGRMVEAGPAPGKHDMHEFKLMSQEKVEAAVESAQAMSQHLMTMNRQLGSDAFSQLIANSDALYALVGCHTLGQVADRHETLWRSWTVATERATELSNSAARFAHRGLRPIHARATANARRLAMR